MKDTRKHLEDPINGLIFFDPVTTVPVASNSGKTYEREEIEAWMKKKKDEGAKITDPLSREEITEKLLSNDLVRGMARDYAETHPEAYKEDKIYLPQAIKNELVVAIRAGNTQQAKDTLKKDPRLITTNLNLEGLTALQAACTQASVEMFQFILEKLPEEESEKRKQELAKIGSLTLTRNIAKFLGVDGLDTWCQYLKFEPHFFYHSLAQQAIFSHEPTLITTLIPRIKLNLQETKTGFTFLHIAVRYCAERLKDKAINTIPDHELAIIKLLLKSGANGKIMSNEGETPAQLAERLGNHLLSAAVEAERRRIKFAFLIEPLQEQIKDLNSKCVELEAAKAQLILTLQNHQQAIAEAQHTQGKQLAISEGLLKIEQQKQLAAFIPCTIKSITCGKKIKAMMAVGTNYVVCGVTDQEHRTVSRLLVFNLAKPSDQSLISSIKLSDRTDSTRFSMLAVDEKSFVYCLEETEQRGNKKEPVKLVLWDGENSEKNYPVAYNNVNIVQVINANLVLFSGKREYKDECAILNLKTGAITPHNHLELVDFNEWHTAMPRPTYYKSNVELAYIHYEKDRNHRMGTPKEIRLYNAIKNTNLCLSNDEIDNFQSSSSSIIFKFVSSKLIVISMRSQYKNNESPTLKVFNIENKQYIQTYNIPPFKQRGFNNPVSEGFRDACLTPDGLLIAAYHDPEQNQGSRLIIWELATGQTKYNLPVEGDIKNLLFDETRNVLYASNGNSIQVYQIYPDNVLRKITTPKQGTDTPTTNSGKVFSL